MTYNLTERWDLYALSFEKSEQLARVYTVLVRVCAVEKSAVFTHAETSNAHLRRSVISQARSPSLNQR